MSRQHYCHTLTIPFQDIDAAGIVFFAHLFRYAHETYERYMSDIGHPLADIIHHEDYLLPLVHAEADYRQPLCHNETMTVELSVKTLGESSFTLHYRCVDSAGQLRAEVQTVHVVLNKATKSPQAIPDSLRCALQPD